MEAEWAPSLRSSLRTLNSDEGSSRSVSVGLSSGDAGGSVARRLESCLGVTMTSVSKEGSSMKERERRGDTRREEVASSGSRSWGYLTTQSWLLKARMSLRTDFVESMAVSSLARVRAVWAVAKKRRTGPSGGHTPPGCPRPSLWDAEKSGQGLFRVIT